MLKICSYYRQFSFKYFFILTLFILKVKIYFQIKNLTLYFLGSVKKVDTGTYPQMLYCN